MLVVIGLCAGVYSRLPVNMDWPALWQAFLIRMNSADQGYLWITVGLMPLNWALETCKWRSLMGALPGWSFSQTFKAVLAGITVSLFTPNRVGEYGGRAIFTPQVYLSESIAAALSGSLAQWVVLLSGACWGGIYLEEKLPAPEYRHYFVIGGTLAMIFLGLFFGTGRVLTGLRNLTARFRVSDRWVPTGVGRKNLAYGLVFAFFRYSIYCLQYVLILRFFGLEGGFIPILAGVCLLYGLQTSLPLSPALALAARAGLAVWLWTQFGGEPLGILGATFGLFIINLLAPSLLGLALIVRIKLKNNKSTYEKLSHEGVGCNECVAASHGL